MVLWRFVVHFQSDLLKRLVREMEELLGKIWVEKRGAVLAGVLEVHGLEGLLALRRRCRTNRDGAFARVRGLSSRCL